MTSGEALRIIDGLGLTQGKFAKLVGVHRNTVSRWSTGEREPGPAMGTLLMLLRERPELVEVLKGLDR